MLNVRRAGLPLAQSLFALLASPALAQTYKDQGGTIVPGVVVVDPTDNSGPLFSSSNPGKVSGTFSATLSGFAPGGAYATPLAVSTTSSRVALPSGTVVVVYNTGSATAYVILGSSSAAATTSDDVVPAGGWMAFTVGSNGYLAAITSSGTTTLNLSGGSGLPTGAGGGGAGGGGANASVGSTGSSVPSSGTYAAMNVSGNLTGLTGTANGLKVDGSAVTQPVTEAGATNSAPATQTITAADAASTPTTVANGQVFVTGAPTANSAASFALGLGYDTVRVQVTGTWVGTLAVEMSPDSGTTWVAQGVHQTGTTYTTNNFTADFLGESNASGFTNVRVRATAWTSGTATVKIILSVNPNSVYLANTVKFSDSTTPTIQNTIKAASTAAAAGDTAQVVALSPNSIGPMNETQINGVTPLMGNGQTGTGAQRVTLSQDNASAPINISTATTTQLVAISGSTSIYVTSFDVIAGGTGNITFEYGTGTNCGTGTTALTGAYPLIANAGISKGSGVGAVLKVPSGNALCALTSAAVQYSGSLSYLQF